MSHIRKLTALLGVTLELGCGAKGTARIAIDSTRTHQTINGWEATVAIDDDGLSAAARDSLIVMVVDRYGITRLRLQAQGNVIESVDHTHYPPELAIGSNDNDDPNVMAPERFWWQIFDRNVKDYVLPIKARAEARGDPFIPQRLLRRIPRVEPGAPGKTRRSTSSSCCSAQPVEDSLFDGTRARPVGNEVVA